MCRVVLIAQSIWACQQRMREKKDADKNEENMRFARKEVGRREKEDLAIVKMTDK